MPCTASMNSSLRLGIRRKSLKNTFYYAINNDLTVDLAAGETVIHGTNHLPWKVHLGDTGLHTQTGGRLKRVEKWLEDDDTLVPVALDVQEHTEAGRRTRGQGHRVSA